MSEKIIIRSSANKKDGKIICNLNVGDHLSKITGLNYINNTYDYEIVEEYPEFYVIAIKYREGLVPESRSYYNTCVSKAAIYCREIVLTKEDGREVKAYQKAYQKRS